MPSHRSSTHMSDKYICYVWGIIKKLSLMAYIRMILISMIYIIVGTIFYNKAIGQYYYIFFMNMRRRASFSSREKEWDKFIQRERRHKHGSTRCRPCLAKLEHHTYRGSRWGSAFPELLFWNADRGRRGTDSGSWSGHDPKHTGSAAWVLAQISSTGRPNAKRSCGNQWCGTGRWWRRYSWAGQLRGAGARCWWRHCARAGCWRWSGAARRMCQVLVAGRRWFYPSPSDERVESQMGLLIVVGWEKLTGFILTQRSM